MLIVFILQRTIDIVKMDIEGVEWKAVPAMLTSGASKYIRQLYLEQHSGPLHASGVFIMSNNVLGSLYDAGFRIFWGHANHYSGFGMSNHTHREVAQGHEIYYLNNNYKRP